MGAILFEFDVDFSVTPPIVRGPDFCEKNRTYARVPRPLPSGPRLPDIPISNDWNALRNYLQGLRDAVVNSQAPVGGTLPQLVPNFRAELRPGGTLLLWDRGPFDTYYVIYRCLSNDFALGAATAYVMAGASNKGEWFDPCGRDFEDGPVYYWIHAWNASGGGPLSIVRVESCGLGGSESSGGESESSAAVEDILIRPTTYTMSPAPGPGVRGTLTDPGGALDAGDDDYLRCETSGGVGGGTSAIIHYQDWADIPSDLTGLLGVTFHARIRWSKNGNSVNPYMFGEIWDYVYTNPALGPGSDPVHGVTDLFQNFGGPTDNAVFTEYVSDPITKARFLEVKNNLTARFGQVMVGEFSLPYPNFDVSEVWAKLWFTEDPFADSSSS